LQEARPLTSDKLPMGSLVVEWLEGQTMEARVEFFDVVTHHFCHQCGFRKPKGVDFCCDDIDE